MTRLLFWTIATRLAGALSFVLMPLSMGLTAAARKALSWHDRADVNRICARAYRKSAGQPALQVPPRNVASLQAARTRRAAR